MGDTIKRETGEEDDEMMEKAEELMHKANKFADTMARAVGDAKTVVDKKEGLEDSKKNSKPSSNSQNAGGDADMDIDEILNVIDKVKALKGNMTLDETQEWIRDNRDEVESLADDFL